MSITFEWDKNKETSNIQKHGISFEEAKTVFYDDSALLIHDPLHSDDEDRFILLGMTFSNKVFVVCHCYKASDNIIRIISARKAGKHEKEQYKARS